MYLQSDAAIFRTSVHQWPRDTWLIQKSKNLHYWTWSTPIVSSAWHGTGFWGESWPKMKDFTFFFKQWPTTYLVTYFSSLRTSWKEQNLIELQRSQQNTSNLDLLCLLTGSHTMTTTWNTWRPNDVRFTRRLKLQRCWRSVVFLGRFGSTVPKHCVNFHLQYIPYNLSHQCDLTLLYSYCLLFYCGTQIAFNETVTSRYGSACVTWSPAQPEQMKCDMTIDNSMVTFNILSAIVTAIFRELFCQFWSSNTQKLFRFIKLHYQN